MLNKSMAEKFCFNCPLSAIKLGRMSDINNKVIEIKNITKSFGNKLVLNKLSLEVESGESLVIIGFSGSGKSVLLRHMIGLEKPDTGQVNIRDTDIGSLEGDELLRFLRQAQISVVFQKPALFDFLTAGENVEFPLTLNPKLDKEAIRAKAEDLLQAVGIPDCYSKTPSDLSGGMSKRVALARAIAIEPKIIFYDEPTTGLDPMTVDKISALIKETNDRLGVTSVTITHDYLCAAWIADRVVYLNRRTGKLDTILTPEDISGVRQEVKAEYRNHSSDTSVFDKQVRRAISDMIRQEMETVDADAEEAQMTKEIHEKQKNALFCAMEDTLAAIGSSVFLFRKPPRAGRFFRSLADIFLASVSLIAPAGIVIGMAMAIQLSVGLSRFGAEDFIPQVLAMSLLRGICPLLVGLLLAGRVGASICAQIGSMRVTRQLDALYSFGVDPQRFLLSPIFFAAIISFPLLVILAEALALVSGGVISVHILHVRSSLYISKALGAIQAADFLIRVSGILL